MSNHIKPAIAFFCASLALAQSWVAQNSTTTASLRGVSAVNADIAWASGTGGTWLRTTNGGATWAASKVPGAEDLDFRDVHAVDEQTAYLLSVGTGDKSRIYKTSDGGKQWKLQFTNPDAKGFFDALAFWDRTHGIVLGDPVDGRFVVLTTEDGGDRWQRRPTPPAMPNEGAFAASGTCLVVMGAREAWFGTGGVDGARVFHSIDGGATWTVARTTIRNDAAAAGIFSLAFSDARHGIAVGGDYTKPDIAERNIAVTSDGGKTWTEPSRTHPKGFRSAVAFLPGATIWIAAGTSGSDVSSDGGNTWTPFDNGNYNAVSLVSDVFSRGAGFAVGPKGRIAKFVGK
ncbi:Glycosyl hydrolase, BNR repeat-containing protein [Candidatus Sulfopaludibacter sp. SbA6]|nr:Glycosyl hydrolase, BNR repeat-containing protein [Candidatus Sulfopaludibacter sp. SbA6]